ncbi:MAG TPA: hypothetical protein VGX49_09115 [Jatrophihabitans sp.]|jgi:hypothetical protein|nr:hypothetical protein [Jatrophihabitans sp.]
MPEDAWAPLADAFVEGAYASVKGRVRTYVLHQQLLAHLPPPPATVLTWSGTGSSTARHDGRLG